MLTRRLIVFFNRTRISGLPASFSSGSSVSGTDLQPKNLIDMPGIRWSWSFYPTLFWRVAKYGGPYRAFYKMFDSNQELFGNIYQAFGGQTNSQEVILSDPQDVIKVFQHEGKYPSRIKVALLNRFYEEYKRKPGVFFSNGHEWLTYRNAISKKMLGVQEIDPYAERFDAVAIDLSKLISRLRSRDAGTCDEVSDLPAVTFNWSFESISTFLYDRRVGTLTDNPSREGRAFLNSVDSFMRSFMKAMFFPPWIDRYYRPKAIKELYQSLDNIYHYADHFITKRLEEMSSPGLSSDDKRLVGFLPSVFASSMSKESLVDTIVDVFFAAVDTTSNTTLWCLYELSRHPEVQEKLYQEITGKLKECKGNLTYGAIQEMVYLRSVIKETLRLYPALLIISRELVDDVTLSGYLIPAGTVVHANIYRMALMPEHFSDPKTYRPERWLRSNKTADQIASYTYMPFGHGVRKCVGRRIAELEISLALVRILERFRLTYPEGQVVEKMQRGVTVPDRPPRIRFHDRS